MDELGIIRAISNKTYNVGACLLKVNKMPFRAHTFVLKQSQNMEAKFSQRVKEVIQYSREEAIRLGHDYIGCEHLLLGIIREGEGKAIQTIKMLDIDALRLKKH